MTRWAIGLGVLAAGAALVVAELELGPAQAAPSGPPRAAEPGATPVLVELFTSEGCSSCPPADAVLARLEHEQPVKGARVIALAHHVDYWDNLGWPDPFASGAATARQRAYAPLGGGTYTPEAVVDGAAQMVGSRGGALESEIAAQAKREHAKVSIVVGAATASGAELTVRVGPLPGASNGAEVVLAVVQSSARVSVERGENSGRTLDHTAIAREVRSLGAVSPAGGAVTTTVRTPSARLASSVKGFSVVAFVQEQTSRRVVGSAEERLSSP